MLKIKDILEDLYTQENALMKHATIFAITSIIAIMSIVTNKYSELSQLTNTQFFLSLLVFIATIILTFYLFGYTYNYVHNLFDENNPIKLPEFSLNQLKISLKALPFIFSWIGYGILAALLMIFAIITKNNFLIAFLLIISPIVTFLVLPTIYVDFARGYSSKGLCNIAKPFIYFVKMFKGLAIFLLKLIPFILFIYLITALSTKANDVVYYLVSAITGYINFILQLVLNHGYAEVFRNTIINNCK